jgi:hypothetical protein
VQIEDDEMTKWQISDEDFCLAITRRIRILTADWTRGSIPRVTVIPEENRNPIDERARQ